MIIKSRKGAAMEMALVMLLVVFALSGVLLTTSLLHSDKRAQIENTAKRELVLEQIGKDFCDNIEGDGSWTSSYPDYKIETAGQSLTVKDNNDRTLLEIELSLSGGTYTVTKWKIGQSK